MKTRRWWSGPRLQQWKVMVAQGDFDGPFAAFPTAEWFAERDEWLWKDKPPAQLPPVSKYVAEEGALNRKVAAERFVERLAAHLGQMR